MSTEIVSLNQYRKAKQKAEKEEQSAANLLGYSRNRAEKRAETDMAEKLRVDMYGRGLDDDPTDDSGLNNAA